MIRTEILSSCLMHDDMAGGTPPDGYVRCSWRRGGGAPPTQSTRSPPRALRGARPDGYAQKCTWQGPWLPARPSRFARALPDHPARLAYADPYQLSKCAQDFRRYLFPRGPTGRLDFHCNTECMTTSNLRSCNSSNLASESVDLLVEKPAAFRS